MLKNDLNEYRKEDVVFIAHRREKDGDIQSLRTHLLETADLSRKFASKIGLEKHGELIGILHDLGKGSKEFNNYICSAEGLINPDEDDYVDATSKKGKIDHSSAGAQAIYNYYKNKGKEVLPTLHILPLIIASHHSGLIDCLTQDGIDNFSRRMHKEDEKTRLKECLNNLDEDVQRRIENLLQDENMIILMNMKIKSLSEENDSTKTLQFKLGLLTKYLYSCLIDADRTNTADFEFPNNIKIRNFGNFEEWEVLSRKLELHLAKFKCENEVDRLRKDISDYCLSSSDKPRGVFKLTVPTGGGKTLASLRFAINHAIKHKMERIVYIIPYTSIIDQNAQTVKGIFEEKLHDGEYDNKIVLEHHSNLTPEEENSRQKLLAENWDSPIVFTTMVQFLETLFGAGTRNIRRLHNLANSILIFDEIQTIPVRCVHMFNVAIRFLERACNSSIVLCTATQPLLNEVTPVERALKLDEKSQIVSNSEKIFEKFKRVEVFDRRRLEGWLDVEVAELAEEELLGTDSVLIIVNTKKAAKNLFQQLRSHAKADVYHLSTNMCPVHRMRIFEKIKSHIDNKKPVICVSTQLIEAGVDIDFGAVIRYLAGLDSIAQAAGRCNRHGKRPQLGRVFVVNPKDENLDKLADIKIGRDISQRVLDEFLSDSEQFNDEILSIEALQRYFKYYFYDRVDKMNYPLKSNSVAGREDSLFELLSTNKLSTMEYRRINKNKLPHIFLRQSFNVAAKAFRAIDSPNIGIVAPYGEEGKAIINDLCSSKFTWEKFKLLKKAQRYSVNIMLDIFQKYLEEKIIFETQKDSGIFYLNEQYYSENYGLSVEKDNEMKLLNV